MRIAKSLFLLVVLSTGAESLQNTVTCFYQSWSAQRPKLGNLFGDEIPAELCTHVVYTYASIFEHKIFTQLPALDYVENNGQGNIPRFVGLKEKNPQLKVLIGVGGWAAGGWIFSNMAATEEGRQTFIVSVIEFCAEHNFDGVVLDWLYPVVPSRAGTPEDVKNFAILLKELREAIQMSDNKNLFVGVTIASASGYVNNYNAAAINSYADLVYCITYDMAGWWNGTILHPAPLFNGDDESVDSALKMWINAGISREKLVMGIPTFARTYAIPKDVAPENALYAKFSGDGARRLISQAPGFLYYPETCAALQHSEYTIVQDPDMKVPYAYSADEMIVYEDQISVQEKARYVQKNKLAGVYIFAIDQDDVKGFCGPSFPLTRAAASVLISGIRPPAVATHQLPSDDRCVSLTSSCSVKAPCFRYPAEALSNDTSPCTKDVPCLSPTGILECPIPRSILASRKDLFTSTSGILFAADSRGQLKQVRCGPREPTLTGAARLRSLLKGSKSSNKANQESLELSNEGLVCNQVGLSGPSVQEYACPPNSVISKKFLRCVVNA